jgi:hypothetical protein
LGAAGTGPPGMGERARQVPLGRRTGAGLGHTAVNKRLWGLVRGGRAAVVAQPRGTQTPGAPTQGGGRGAEGPNHRGVTPLVGGRAVAQARRLQWVQGARRTWQRLAATAAHQALAHQMYVLQGIKRHARGARPSAHSKTRRGFRGHVHHARAHASKQLSAYLPLSGAAFSGGGSSAAARKP